MCCSSRRLNEQASRVVTCVDRKRAAEASFGCGMYSLTEPSTALAWLLDRFALQLSPAQLLVASRVELCKDDVEGRTSGSDRAAASTGSCCAWNLHSQLRRDSMRDVSEGSSSFRPCLGADQNSRPVSSTCFVERLLLSSAFRAQEQESFSFLNL